MNDTQIIYSCLVGGPGIAVAVFIAGPVANTPARCPLHRRKQSMSLLYMVIVGSILNEVAPAPLPFPIYRYVIYLCMLLPCSLCDPSHLLEIQKRNIARETEFVPFDPRRYEVSADGRRAFFSRDLSLPGPFPTFLRLIMITLKRQSRKICWDFFSHE